MVDELSRQWKGKDGFLFINFDGQKSQSLVGLRSHLRKNGIKMGICKNSLIGLAMKKNGIEIPQDSLRKPTAVLWGDETDIVNVCKVFSLWEKAVKEVPVKCLYAFGKIWEPVHFEQFLKMPSKQALQTRFAGLLAGTLSSFLSMMQSHFHRFLLLMQEHHKKMGGS